MNGETLLAAIGDIGDDLIVAAAQPRRVRHVRRWAAACLCLILAGAAAWLALPRAETPETDTRDGPPSVTLDGRTYVISPYLHVEAACPAGFRQGGTVDVAGEGPCAYFVSEEEPAWVYVLQTVRTDGAIDAHGALIPTAPHLAYARYVDARIRGSDYVCRDGTLYVSLWCAHGEDADYAAAVQETWGIRLEGAPPAGFCRAGTAAFSGHDTVPTGALGSNTGEEEVWYDPQDARILLVSTSWHTATAEEGRDTRHTGFNVYVRCQDPLCP